MPTPLFFIGTSPSMASAIINCDASTSGVMVSMTQLRERKSDFEVSDWILDSGAFTEVTRHGDFREPVETYYQQIRRWSRCGNLLVAVAQDYMCEPFALTSTGLTVADHQRLTIERYDALTHLAAYAQRLAPGAWVGVGSICRRNGSPREVADILRAIKVVRPDLRLHGFGLKQTALADAEVRSLLYSADSMAWSYPRRFMSAEERRAVDPLQMARDYQERVSRALAGKNQRRATRTSGAGNGQGRKSKWRAGKTKAIRVPEVFADRLLELARRWDKEY